MSRRILDTRQMERIRTCWRSMVPCAVAAQAPRRHDPAERSMMPKAPTIPAGPIDGNGAGNSGESPWLPRPARPDGGGRACHHLLENNAVRSNGLCPSPSDSSSDDPTAASGLRELAAIFAAGFLRLRSRPGYIPAAHDMAADSSKRLSESPGAFAPPSAPCAHRLTPAENREEP